MSCRAVLCQECATTYDGINFCRTCLDQRSGAKSQSTSWFRVGGHLVAGLVVLGMLTICAWLMAWVATVLAGSA